MYQPTYHYLESDMHHALTYYAQFLCSFAVCFVPNHLSFSQTFFLITSFPDVVLPSVLHFVAFSKFTLDLNLQESLRYPLDHLDLGISQVIRCLNLRRVLGVIRQFEARSLG